MPLPDLPQPWLPVIVSALLADLNFWYWASTEEHDAEYLGIALFAAFGIYWTALFLSRRRRRDAVAGFGAFAALLAMVLRQTGTFDLGYIPPYALFIVFVLLGYTLG
ncbi:MAG: hypothetical protein ACRD16_09580 [Thermoanaerobaculia bacterium]